DVEDCRRKKSGLLQSLVKNGKLCRRRQLPMDQQIGHFLEGRMGGEVVNGVAAITQFTLRAVDEGDAGALEIDALQAAVDLDAFVHLSEFQFRRKGTGMGCIDRAFAAARRLQGRIVMPEMEDSRIAAAAARLRAEKLAEPLDLSAARP